MVEIESSRQTNGSKEPLWIDDVVIFWIDDMANFCL